MSEENIEYRHHREGDGFLSFDPHALTGLASGGSYLFIPKGFAFRAKRLLVDCMAPKQLIIREIVVTRTWPDGRVIKTSTEIRFNATVFETPEASNYAPSLPTMQAGDRVDVLLSNEAQVVQTVRVSMYGRWFEATQYAAGFAPWDR